MRRTLGLALVSTLVALTVLAQEAEQSDADAANEARRARVYAQIGDAAVTVGDIEDAVNKQSPFLRGRYRDPAKLRELADSLVRLELLAREAERRDYDENPIVERSVKQNIVQQLIKRRFDDVITRETITDEEIQAFYDANQDQFSRSGMVRASHILLDTREEAAALMDQAREADARTFRGLARQHSIDTETKLRGGDLRYFTRNGLPAGAREDDPPVDAQIVEAAFALTEIGSVSPEPVAVGDNWSIVKLMGRREAEVRTLEQAAEGIRLRLWREKRQSAIEEFVAQLRRDHPPEVHQERMRPIRLDALPTSERVPTKAGEGPSGGVHGRQAEELEEAN